MPFSPVKNYVFAGQKHSFCVWRGGRSPPVSCWESGACERCRIFFLKFGNHILFDPKY